MAFKNLTVQTDGAEIKLNYYDNPTRVHTSSKITQLALNLLNFTVCRRMAQKFNSKVKVNFIHFIHCIYNYRDISN